MCNDEAERPRKTTLWRDDMTLMKTRTNQWGGWGKRGDQREWTNCLHYEHRRETCVQEQKCNRKEIITQECTYSLSALRAIWTARGRLGGWMKPWSTRRENQTGSPHQPGGITLTLPPYRRPFATSEAIPWDHFRGCAAFKASTYHHPVKANFNDRPNPRPQQNARMLSRLPSAYINVHTILLNCETAPKHCCLPRTQ